MDVVLKRKVSPRAPSVALDEAIKRVGKMYKAEGRHVTPIDVALKHIGYRGRSGAALKTLAALGYWGLVERPNGAVVVSKAFEDYQYTPNDQHKKELLNMFLVQPGIFSGLLKKYQDRLPSDATLQYDLIQIGFTPTSAAACLSVFKRSIEFAGYFDRPQGVLVQNAESAEEPAESSESAANPVESQRNGGIQVTQDKKNSNEITSQPVSVSSNADFDRIPIRLVGGRKAWLEIPMPFYKSDKERLKMFIDFLLADDENAKEAP